MNSFSYYGGRSFSWEGRELRSLTNGDTTASYVYNESGIRTSKTVDGVTTNYLLEGSRIIFQTVGSTRWTFLYYGDELTGFEVDGETYYYLKNLQGDILQIVDEDGEVVVEYLYDDWGKILSVTGELSDTVGEENPFRYRGYYYDSETGLYYVSSRYYDPEVGRFINADEIDYLGADEGLLSYNLFAYCLNNPINRTDEDGNLSLPNWAKKVVAAVAVVAVVAAVAAVTVATAGAGTAIAAVAVGAAKGAAIGFAVGAVSGAALGYVTTGTLEGTLNGMEKALIKGHLSKGE